MRTLFRTALVLPAIVFAAPTGALAQAAASFDGTYAGVSLMTSGSGHSCAAASPVPGPLMISGGKANSTQGQTVLQGTVSAQGNLTMRTALGTVFTGKVEADGTAHGGLMSGHDCTYTFTWKKR